MDHRNDFIYERLLRLPLFQGMSQDGLIALVGHTKLEFSRIDSGQTVCSEGSPCDSMIFLMSGQLTLISHADDHSYQVEERLSAPMLLPPEYLFGLSQRHPHSCVSTSPCELLILSKMEVLRLLESNHIFRANLLNIIATRTQRLARRAWHPSPRTIRQKICRYLSDRCHHPAGEKTFHLKMQQMATAIGESRLNVSHELHAMEQEGLLKLSRGALLVWAMERLYSPSPVT